MTVSGFGNYLLLPVWAGLKESPVSVGIDGAKFMFLMVTFPEQTPFPEPDFFAGIPVVSSDAAAHTAVITAKNGTLPDEYGRFVSFSETIPEPVAGRRPGIHFAPNTGWINDPNGMVYHNGVYHLYFQYNPFNTKWENMSWGHAQSKDLLHWEQSDTVLFPDETATSYSGCGLVNTRALLNQPADALLFFYTYAGKDRFTNSDIRFSQRIACSTDGGKTVFPVGMALDAITFDNRDPKVFFYGDSETGHYVMVLWIEGNTFAIFTSCDLSHWEESQRLTFPPAWECPDLYELDCLENGTPRGMKKWVFTSAGGHYLVGSFDGEHFTAEQDVQSAYCTQLPYAAQTFSNTPGKTISVAWLRTKGECKLYHGVMALPRELYLAQRNGVWTLVHKPVEQYVNARRQLTECSVIKNPWELDIYKEEDSSVVVRAGDRTLFSLQCNCGSVTLLCGETSCSFIPTAVLHCLVDNEVLEITSEDWICIAQFEIAPVECGEKISISGDGCIRSTVFSVAS